MRCLQQFQQIFFSSGRDECLHLIDLADIVLTICRVQREKVNL